jgi:hypothetical protein
MDAAMLREQEDLLKQFASKAKVSHAPAADDFGGLDDEEMVQQQRELMAAFEAERRQANEKNSETSGKTEKTKKKKKKNKSQRSPEATAPAVASPPSMTPPMSEISQDVATTHVQEDRPPQLQFVSADVADETTATSAQFAQAEPDPLQYAQQQQMLQQQQYQQEQQYLLQQQQQQQQLQFEQQQQLQFEQQQQQQQQQQLQYEMQLQQQQLQYAQQMQQYQSEETDGPPALQPTDGPPPLTSAGDGPPPLSTASDQPPALWNYNDSLGQQSSEEMPPPLLAVASGLSPSNAVSGADAGFGAQATDAATGQYAYSDDPQLQFQQQQQQYLQQQQWYQQQQQEAYQQQQLAALPQIQQAVDSNAPPQLVQVPSQSQQFGQYPAYNDVNQYPPQLNYEQWGTSQAQHHDASATLGQSTWTSGLGGWNQGEAMQYDPAALAGLQQPPLPGNAYPPGLVNPGDDGLGGGSGGLGQ